MEQRYLGSSHRLEPEGTFPPSESLVSQRAPGPVDSFLGLGGVWAPRPPVDPEDPGTFCSVLGVSPRPCPPSVTRDV